MQPQDRQKFSEIVLGTMAYYNQSATPFVAELWWQACQPYSLEQLNKALSSHVTDPERGMFAPKVADVVRVLSGTHTDRAVAAWGKAHDAASSIGAYTDVVFDDPVIHIVIEDLGGWPKFCRTESKDLGYLQHRFCEFYRSHSQTEGVKHPARLAGDRSPDSEYRRKGLPLPRARHIGDREQAVLVYRSGGASGAKTKTGGRSVAALAAQAVAMLPRGMTCE